MRKLSRITLLLILIFQCIPLQAQGTRQDSITAYFQQISKLVQTKQHLKEDFFNTEFLLAQDTGLQNKEAVHNLLKLFIAHIYKSDQLANKYNDQALQLARHIGYEKGILSAMYNQAYLLFVKGHFDASMNKALQVEKRADYDSYPEVYGDIATLKSDIYTEKGEYDKALETGLKLLEEAEKSKHDYLLMKANAALSHYYLRIENYSKSLSYCLAGLHYILKLKQTQYIYPKIDEIARMTAKLKDPLGALRTYSFYLDIENRIPSPGSYIQSSVYMNMGDLYMSINDFEKAQQYLSLALEMVYENEYLFRIPRAWTMQAELFLKTNDTANAQLSYEKSIVAAEQIDAFDVIKQNSAILSELFTRTHQLSKAYEYKTLFRAIKDSLFTNEKEQRILLLEAKHNIREVIQEKKILELENKAQREKFDSIIIVLALLFATSSLAIFSYLKVKQKNKLLMTKAIQLTKIQVGMKKKLAGYQNTPAITTTKKRRSNFSKNQTTIDKDVQDIILTKLEKLEKEHFYLDTNCNLHLLAEQLKTNPKYLSQVINQGKKTNFNNYINELRINYLLPKLLTDLEFRNYKLNYIAVSLGYNNLNTFNTAFKKRLGILPSNFIEELNKEGKIWDEESYIPSILMNNNPSTI
ncbi:MAG TPA: helix-turn-helix domain-containing protein [Arenibacter sp.]|nr:helix-turn-helix domain-containing protein [Arenibacter sp.]